MDVLAFIADLQHSRLIACAFALLAQQLDICQELHFNGHRAIALASLAASAGNVEREMSCAEAAFGRLWN